MKRVMILAIVAVVGCGGGDATDVVAVDDDAPACADVYAEGAVVTEAVTGGTCLDDAGMMQARGAIRYACPDGSEIGWNDLAWWANGVVHLHDDGAELVAPAEHRERCTEPVG